MENPSSISVSPALRGDVRQLRLKSWQLIYEASGFVVSERLQQMQALLVKYSPNQPRVPAGDSAGGQWTSGGGGESGGSGDVVRSPNSMLTDDSLSYPDGKPVIDPNTAEPYSMSESIDILDNIKFANALARTGATELERALVMGYLFRAGGPQDYQRPNGFLAALGGDRQMSNRNVTNYNYGAVAAAMGYSQDEALKAAGLYNRYFGNMQQPNMTDYNIAQDAVNNISHGYNDYHNGSWPFLF